MSSTRQHPVRGDADDAAYGLGRRRMVARDDEDANAGGLRASDGIGHLGAWRVPQQHEPEEGHRLLALSPLHASATTRWPCAA